VTSIEAVSTYHPPDRAAVGDRLRAFDFTESQVAIYERFYGFRSVRLDHDGGLADQLLATLTGSAWLRGREGQIRYVMHARSMPVVAPYPLNPLREVCRQAGLAHAQTFSVSQHACASALLAIHLAGDLLAGDGDPRARAVVLTGDKAFTASARALVAAGVMGESAAAVLVRPGGDRDRMLGYATRTHGRFHQGPWMPPELHAAFQDFYPAALAEVITDAVRAAGLRLADVALILPHNVNRMSWMRVLRLLGFRGTGRLFLDNQPELGHCFCADSFINYETARRVGRLRPGQRYVMTAVGLGATFSAMVFEH
jgi:3-oxoacyl-[acyl-carrier-protein] synthase-3